MKSIITLFLIASFLNISLPIYKEDPLNQIRVKQDGIWVYNVDFTQKYKKTLDAMFGYNWRVKSKEEKKEVPEEMCSHVDSTPFKYTEWIIEYTDVKGKLQEFILNNTEPLSEQIEYYIENYVPEFYKKNFYDKYFKNVPLAGASYVFGFLDRVAVNPQNDENKVRVEMIEKYRKNLETPEGAICFSKFTAANAFEMCPMYLSISVSIADGGYSASEKQKIEEYTRKQVELMLADMNSFTNNKINVEIRVVSNQGEDTLYDENGHWEWYYVQGVPKDEPTPFDDFERHVYDAYIGLFW